MNKCLYVKVANTVSGRLTNKLRSNIVILTWKYYVLKGKASVKGLGLFRVSFSSLGASSVMYILQVPPGVTTYSTFSEK